MVLTSNDLEIQLIQLNYFTLPVPDQGKKTLYKFIYIVEYSSYLYKYYEQYNDKLCSFKK